MEQKTGPKLIKWLEKWWWFLVAVNVSLAGCLLYSSYFSTSAFVNRGYEYYDLAEKSVEKGEFCVAAKYYDSAFGEFAVASERMDWTKPGSNDKVKSLNKMIELSRNNRIHYSAKCLE